MGGETLSSKKKTRPHYSYININNTEFSFLYHIQENRLKKKIEASYFPAFFY